MDITTRYTFPKNRWAYKGYTVRSETIDKEYDELEKELKQG